MAAKRIQLVVPMPCQQRWQDMEPDASGRFCGSCHKTVIDFTGMTDQQIVDVLARHTDSACGRFRSGQLNRSLTATQSTSHSPTQFLGLLTAGLVGFQTSQAEIQPALATPVTIRVTNGPVDTLTESPVDGDVPTDSSRVITGRIVDQSESAPLSGARVSIKGTSTGANTDEAGNFNLLVPSGNTSEMPVLQVMMIGYQTCEIQVSPNQLKPLSIKLYEDVAALGEVIVTGGYKKLSFWQRLRNRFRASH